MKKESVIAGFARTPIGSFQGALNTMSAVHLGGISIQEALDRSGINNEDVDEVIMGNVLSNSRPLKLTKGKSAGQFSQVKYKAADGVLEDARNRVKTLLDRYPLYPELDLQFLQKAFS